jgi:hypothetical protein
MRLWIGLRLFEAIGRNVYQTHTSEVVSSRAWMKSMVIRSRLDRSKPGGDGPTPAITICNHDMQHTLTKSPSQTRCPQPLFNTIAIACF